MVGNNKECKIKSISGSGFVFLITVEREIIADSFDEIMVAQITFDNDFLHELWRGDFNGYVYITYFQWHVIV